MLFPTLCSDSFFNEPEKVVDFSKTLEYRADPNGKWPGHRTKCLSEIDINFFNYMSQKIISLIYPKEYPTVKYFLNLYFHKISKDYKYEGWIHTDRPVELTSIVYLSKHKNCGTSIYDPKKIYGEYKNLINKEIGYLDVLKQNEMLLKENNSSFEESIIIKSKYNRILMFDSSVWHGAQKYIEENINEDRLTLIGFFKHLSAEKYPVIESKRFI